MVKMAPYAGIIEAPLNILAMILTYGTSFVARGFSGQANMLTDLYIQAIQHKGFSFVHALSPCPTFYNTYDSWKQLVKLLPENFDPTDRVEAIRLALTEDVFHLGVFHKEERPTMEEMVGTVITMARGDQEVTVEKLLDMYV